MNHFTFWQKWLFGVGLCLTAFGVLLAFFNQSRLFDLLFNAQIDPIFWKGGQETVEIARFQQWVYGVLGAVIAGWGVCFAFLACYPFRNQERWAWNAMALGITVWYVADTALSLYFGVVFNAVINTILFATIWLPLAFTRKHF